jgi:hypothetical protein
MVKFYKNKKIISLNKKMISYLSKGFLVPSEVGLNISEVAHLHSLGES